MGEWLYSICANGCALFTRTHFREWHQLAAEERENAKRRNELTECIYGIHRQDIEGKYLDLDHSYTYKNQGNCLVDCAGTEITANVRYSWKETFISEIRDFDLHIVPHIRKLAANSVTSDRGGNPPRLRLTIFMVSGPPLAVPSVQTSGLSVRLSRSPCLSSFPNHVGSRLHCRL
jgi:hypothetical protein